ncbi:MAG: TPM domain-containing protein [Bryobacteraceae bacterium]|jgi:uncharacterized protein
MKKRLRLGLLLAVGAFAARAADWKALRPEGYVSDYAGVIDAASKAQLEAYCAAVERATGAQMALVTVTTLEGEPIEDAANAIFRNWGVGARNSNEGVMLLLAIGERRSRLEVGYGLEGVLPDARAGDILREMSPALRDGLYGEAMMAGAQTIGEIVAQAKSVSLSSSLRRTIQRTPSNSIPWPLVLGGIFVLAWLLRAGGPRGYGGWSGGGFLPGLLMGNLMARSTWGGRGSGGFGGYDSGDGFGGFGGGDSGGGGASGDW